MGFFRKDAEQPTPIANESGTSSPTEKLGDDKIEDVTPTREVDAAEEQRLIRKLDRRIVPMMVSLTIGCRLYDSTLTSTSPTGLDVSDEVGLHSDELLSHHSLTAWIQFHGPSFYRQCPFIRDGR